MRLLGSLTSPYVRKVRVALAEKRLNYLFELEDAWSRSVPMDHLNPLGKVPCLILENNHSIFDSRTIIEYIDTLSISNPLIPVDGHERARVRVYESLAEGILDAAVSARLEATWPGREPNQRSQAWIDRQMGKVTSSLNYLSKNITDQAFFAGNTFSVADISIVCALDYLDFRFPEFEWKINHHRLAFLQENIGKRPSFPPTH
ncbi:glutathione S-transferase N-terminal domain-containing protein [Leptothrix ochracea]|nr:glutathione S-transferase N-terminal domain-containing protein [Leptothrix ochracea]